VIAKGMQNQTTFYVVRHGETEWNVQGLMQGHQDSPLTANGKQQIHDLAAELKDIHFDHVFSSDLLRAKQTAEILAIQRQLAVNMTRLLRERSFGKYEGRPRQEFEEENRELIARYESLSGKEKIEFKYADDMESSGEVASRLLTFLRETAVAYSGKHILVVAHGGVLRVLLQHLGYKVKSGPGTIGNAAYIKLLSDGVEFAVEETKGIQLQESP
jgi:broad specificity phosphatase PhoE